MTFIVSNLIKGVLKAHQIERYQAFVLSWRFQGVPPPPPVQAKIGQIHHSYPYRSSDRQKDPIRSRSTSFAGI